MTEQDIFTRIETVALIAMAVVIVGAVILRIGGADWRSWPQRVCSGLIYFFLPFLFLTQLMKERRPDYAHAYFVLLSMYLALGAAAGVRSSYYSGMRREKESEKDIPPKQKPI